MVDGGGAIHESLGEERFRRVHAEIFVIFRVISL